MTARTLVAALAVSLGAAALPAHAEVLDHSNSASATGNPFVYSMAVTQEQAGATPADNSNSASAVGDAFAFGVPTTRLTANETNIDWSNSASAVGGPDFGAPSGQMAASLR